MRISFALLLLAFLACPLSAAESEEGFTPLFDGKSLEGWKKVGGGATYKVEEGCVVGEVGPGANTFLRTEKTYGDFILKLEAKLDVPGNSGIQFRSHQKPGDNGTVFGYQCEIDPSARAWTAGIYDESRRGWLYPLGSQKKSQEAYKAGEWNEFVIECRGPHIQTTLNGVPCADLLDAADLEGFIALQVHAGKEGRIRWRNIRLKDLGQSKWKEIGGGAKLEGWEQIGGGKWSVEESKEGPVIHAVQEASEGRHGLLITKEKFSDFAIRLEYKALKGNSGLYFRTERGGGGLGVLGFQAEIDPQNDVGGLYETGGRAWVVQPKPEDVKKWHKAEQWNTMTVIALGDRVVVQVNGQKTAELKNDPGRKEGYIALQLHGGQEMDVAFRKVELLDLSKQTK